MAMTQHMFGTPGATGLGIVGSVTGSLTATGSTQGTALEVCDDVNVITTAAASTGVILKRDLSPGDRQVIANLGASSLSVYPTVGGKINSLATNGAFAVAAGKVAEFICTAAPSGAFTFIGILSA